MTDSPALAHLRAFRATFNDGDEVDEESGLTAADLDVAIEALEMAPQHLREDDHGERSA